MRFPKTQRVVSGQCSQCGKPAVIEMAHLKLCIDCVKELPGIPNCVACSQPILVKEEGAVVGHDRTFHRKCLACAVCGKQVDKFIVHQDPVKGEWISCRTCAKPPPQCWTCREYFQTDDRILQFGLRQIHQRCYKCGECGKSLINADGNDTNVVTDKEDKDRHFYHISCP